MKASTLAGLLQLVCIVIFIVIVAVAFSTIEGTGGGFVCASGLFGALWGLLAGVQRSLEIQGE